MKYIRQSALILLFTLAGELCHILIPVPIPASIWGMVLMLAALAIKLLRVEAVKETGSFLVSLLPMLFVVPTVGLLGCMDLIRGNIVRIALMIILTTVLAFGVSGLIAKALSKGGEDRD